MNWIARIFAPDLIATIAELKLVNDILRSENNEIRARLRELELDERNLRLNLLTRVGLVAPDNRNGQKREEYKAVKKVTVPWTHQAAKLEADSRERYWKKVIEERERPIEQRKAESEMTEKSEQDQIQADIDELSR